MDNKNEVRYGGSGELDLAPSFDISKVRNKVAERRQNATINSRDIGNRALNSSGNNDDDFRVEQSDLVIPPSTDEKLSSVSGVDVNAEIKTAGTLSDKAVQAIDNAVDKFSENGKAADFYNVVRDYMEDNLKNSYNRKLGK